MHPLVGRTTELVAILEALADPTIQALLIYGPRTIGKSALLHVAMQEMAQVHGYTLVYLNLRATADWARADVIRTLAVTLVEQLALDSTLLVDFSPNTFHTTFIEQAVQRLSPTGLVVFVCDDVDLVERTLLGRLNNLLLPLLRRLATRDRCKFIIAVDDFSADSMRLLATPIFHTIWERKLTRLDAQATDLLFAADHQHRPLPWTSDEIKAQLWTWTAGHPYLITQLSTALRDELATPSTAKGQRTFPMLIEAVLPDVLAAIRDGMLWHWNSLSPAARTVVSIIAASTNDTVTEEMLESVLSRRGVENWRMALAELRQKDWIETIVDGIRMPAELMRLWIIHHYPPATRNEGVNRAKEPIVRVTPLDPSAAPPASPPKKLNTKLLFSLIFLILILLFYIIWLLSILNQLSVHSWPTHP